MNKAKMVAIRSILEWSALGLLLLLIAAVLLPVFMQERDGQNWCLTHLKQIGMAIEIYHQDYDGCLPMRENWCDALMPYVKDAKVFQCPDLPDQKGGYAYNGKLSKVLFRKILSPTETIMVYETKGGWNLSGGPGLADFRHHGGQYVLFADRHTKWQKDLNSVIWDPAAKSSPVSNSPGGHGPGSG